MKTETLTPSVLIDQSMKWKGTKEKKREENCSNITEGQ